MKAKELSDLLMENPDFDVDFAFMDKNDNNPIWKLTLRTFDITGIGDIGYSEKLIRLKGKEE